MRVAASFVAAGIQAVAYTSEIDVEQRQRVLGEFRAGAVSVLCVVDVLNEGADLPFVECLLFLRPTESKRVYFQQLGRGLRRYAGKAFCLVIDFIGNFKNANRIIEYQDLLPVGETPSANSQTRQNHPKNILNLPLGCQVTFDDRVIDLFYDQTLDTSFISSHNIRRILMFQHERLARRLGHLPTRKELDRNCVIGSNIYATCFGSWKVFEETMASATI